MSAVVKTLPRIYMYNCIAFPLRKLATVQACYSSWFLSFFFFPTSVRGPSDCTRFDVRQPSCHRPCIWPIRGCNQNGNWNVTVSFSGIQPVVPLVSAILRCKSLNVMLEAGLAGMAFVACPHASPCLWRIKTDWPVTEIQKLATACQPFHTGILNTRRNRN